MQTLIQLFHSLTTVTLNTESFYQLHFTKINKCKYELGRTDTVQTHRQHLPRLLMGATLTINDVILYIIVFTTTVSTRFYLRFLVFI